MHSNFFFKSKNGVPHAYMQHSKSHHISNEEDFFSQSLGIYLSRLSLRILFFSGNGKGAQFTPYTTIAGTNSSVGTQPLVEPQ